nr:odorant receptor [Petromyzon marinus]
MCIFVFSATMMTSTISLDVNVSKENNSSTLGFLHTYNQFSDIIVIISILPCAAFLVCMMLTIFGESKLRENPKYIFFVNLVISDCIFLLIIDIPSIMFLSRISFNVGGCYFYANLYRGLFNNGVACIAFMAIERYVAICNPLRYHSIFNNKSSLRCLGVIWFISFVFPFIEIIFTFTNYVSVFHQTINSCFNINEKYVLEQSYNITYIRQSLLVIFFCVSIIILLSTYILVANAAKQAASGESQATKAKRTLRLHALQLILYLSAFGIQPFNTLIDLTVNNSDLKYTIKTFLYFFMFISPRFISPFIYGLRDSEIRRCLRQKVCRVHSFLKVEPQLK